MSIEEYASLRATPELVGREDILQKIHEAIKEERSATPHVFYITAPGGWGKTRLVNAVLKKLDSEKTGEWSSPNILSSSRLVDLYHTYTHSEEGVIADIVEVLDDEKSFRYFKKYAQHRAELDRVKYDLAEILRTVTLQRIEMMMSFIEDFNDASSKFEKVVLAFDTVENLMYEEDQVQSALGLADEPIGVGGWLIKEFLSKIHNTVVLIAGRPETPQLKNELEKLEQNGKIKFTHIELGTFSEAETLSYFDAVLGVLREENPRIADQLNGIPLETRQAAHYLSDGQPFLLSLFIDYLTVADELLPEIRIPLDEIKQRAVSENGLQKEREEFRDAILQEFQRIRRPFNEVIQTLSWAEKGMGAVLLAWIMKRGEPSEEEIEQAKGYIETLRDPDLRLSFVKIRDIDNLVFLQDEMYKLMRSLHQRGRLQHNVKQTYELITSFYKRRIKDQASVVEGLVKDIKEFTEDQKEHKIIRQQDLRKGRARLQSYQVEHVYYSLQADRVKGMQEYYRAAEAAFQSNDTNLWLLLRDELLKFAKPYRSDSNNQIVLNFIDGDIGVRWIKSNIAGGDYEKALQQIIQFRNECPHLLKEGSFIDLSMKIWESWALTYSGKDYKRAEDILQGVFASLGKLVDEFEPEFDAWRLKLLTAYAYDITGYLYRSQGNFEKAVEFYRKNIRLWRELDIDSEHANTLNNMSWSLAEVGDFNSAVRYCNDALDLRRKLGHRYPIALSLNTLGLIEIRNGLPDRAIVRCKEALDIFRDLEQPRGIGLACTALAESLRRSTTISDLLKDKDVIDNLDLAEQYAVEAKDIFTNSVKERLRLVEAYIELGCVYREIARRKKEDEVVAMDFVAKGEKAFDAAVENSEPEFIYRGVDALINKAWMYYYIEDFGKVEKIVDQALKKIEEPYMFTKDHAPFRNNKSIPWLWVQLGKAHLLLGKMAFDKFEKIHKQDGGESDAERYLNMVARHWMLSFAYNKQYGVGFRDVLKAHALIYKCLGPLNKKEMAWIRSGVNIVYNEYGDSEDLKVFEKIVDENFD